MQGWVGSRVRLGERGCAGNEEKVEQAEERVGGVLRRLLEQWHW